MNVEELFKPYAKTHSWGEVLIWMRRTAEEASLLPEVVESAVFEIFREIEKGRKFALDGHDGKFKNWAHADISYYLKERMIEINKELAGDQAAAMQRVIDNRLKIMEKKPGWIMRKLKRGP